ncbi:hypothetical protein [Flagellimonas sp. W118]|uniref:hypothetical protein n=1 Tax=Flagellimonas sp. W118 TaxID=3410791 RepID=UPI003BF4F16A
MRKAKNILVVILLVSIESAAQTYTKRQEFSVMNPTSFEISKFGLTPLNPYTGKAQVSFPIFSMNLDGKELPFTLTYDTGGVRVGQEASWIGLGWNLSGIPVITHQINQKSDIGNKPPNHFRGFCYEPKLPVDETEFDVYRNWINNGNYPGAYTEPDTQPDVFVANLIGSTVKFQLTQEASTGTIQALILNDSNAQIDYYDGAGTSEFVQHFDIIDEDGYVYKFTHVEYGTTWSQTAGSILSEYEANSITGQQDTTFNASQENFVPTAWYADQIISPDGEVLDFKYEYEIDDTPNVTVSHPIYHSTTKVTACGSAEGSNNVGTGWKFGSFDEVIATRTIQESMILSEIVHSSTGNKLVFTTASRDDLFAYSTSLLAGFNGYGQNFDPIPKRLTTVELFSSTNKSIRKVDFQQSYFNAYKSSDVDAKSFLRLKLDGFKLQDQQYAFKYKCDDALPEKHSKSTDFWGFYNGVSNVRRTPSVKYDANVCLLETPDLINGNGELVGATKGSSFEHGLIGTLQEIRFPTGGIAQFEYESNMVTLDLTSTQLTVDDFNFPYLLNHNIEAGYPKSGTNNPNYKIVPVGGLRIKSVVNTDASGNPLLRKSYKYDEIASNGDIISSGRLMDGLHHYRTLLEIPTVGVLHSNIIVSSGNLFSTNGSALGSHLGYGRVEEIHENINGNVNIGRTVTHFINKPNESLKEDANGIKFIVETPPINYEDANGRMLKQETFDRSGNAKRTVVNSYEYPNYPNLPLGWKVFYGSSQNGFNINATASFVSDYYSFAPKKYVALVSRDTITEILDGSRKLVNTTFNQYNNKSRLKSSEKTTSEIEDVNTGNGIEEIPIKARTEFYYPYSTEFGVSDVSIVEDLEARNQISRPVYTRYFENDNLIGHQLTKYKKFNGNQFTKPEGVYFGKTDSSLGQMENRVKYERYDLNGNLTEYSEANGNPISAIWGYDGEYMVAKLNNVNYSQIEALPGFGVNFDLQNSTLSSAQKDTLRNNSSMSNTLITFYDHDPLVGPVSIEDERGYKTKYEYDPYNRLSAIRDEDNNLLEDYSYQFTNVSLYPQQTISECFDTLVLGGINVLGSSDQYVDMTVQPSGGVGNYEYSWYLGEGPSKNEVVYHTKVSSTNGYNWLICCDERKYMKVVVTSGSQTKSIEFSNQDYQLNCQPNPCQNPN